MVVTFGTLFNNIRLVRYNKAGTMEIERVTVPLSYSGKEKFYTRTTQDPDLFKEVQMTLPRMYFELESINYDPLRKRSLFLNEFGGSTTNTVRSAYKTPYNFNFNLGIYVRNTEDGTQIIEQILPYFNPDYTVTVDLVDVGNPIDIPIVLQTVSSQMMNDTGSPQETRVINWNLTFLMQGYLFGPITSDGNSKLIRKTIANTYVDTSGVEIEQRISVSSGSGDYKIGELVYQGKTLETSNVTAFVKAWDSTSNNLIVYDVNGNITPNANLRGVVTNANYLVSSFDDSVNKVITLTVEPDPLSANANDDFGFTETIYEYPNLP